MKKLTALLLAIAMMVTCTLCAVAEDGKTYMAVCIASEPDTLDPALNSAVDGATMVAHLFAGLSTWAQTDDGKLEILPDCPEVVRRQGSDREGLRVRVEARCFLRAGRGLWLHV